MLISKIRQYSWVVVGLIALSLILFLVQDATNSNTGIFNKNKAPKFAEIDGEEVSRDEFSDRRGKAILEYLTFNNQVLAYEQGQYQLDPRTQFELGEKAWTDYVNEKLIDKNLNELGLSLTDKEFSNIIYGPDPHPVIKNYYIGLSQTVSMILRYYRGLSTMFLILKHKKIMHRHVRNIINLFHVSRLQNAITNKQNI